MKAKNLLNQFILIMVTLSLCACDTTVDRQSVDSLISEPKVREERPDSDEIVTDDNEAPLPVSTPQSQVSLPPIEPLDIEGDLIAAGSAAVFPLTQTIYQMFVKDGYAGTLKLDALGTTEGFKLFCEEGKSDIVNASRQIRNEELAACQANGRQPVSFRVGTDALVVVLSSKNDFVDDISLADFAQLFSAELWSDLNPAYPREPIERFVPGLESATLDFLGEILYDGEIEPILESSNTQLVNTSESLLGGVNRNQYAIAVVDYTTYLQSSGDFEVLSVEGVEANADTIEKNQYPLSRPLLIYSDAQIIRNKPQVFAFINYYLTYIYKGIAEVGYLPVSVETLDQEKTEFLELIN